MPDIDRRLSGGEVIDGRLVIHSLSGHERNHLFMNQGSEGFMDVSLVSGADSPSDSRGFALVDFDHDGFQDIALVNANAPLLNLFRNTLGGPRQSIDRKQATRPSRNFVALQFVGGSQAGSETNMSCRDGFGTVVDVTSQSMTWRREHRCGEGYGTQNSSTMIVGIGDAAAVESLRVTWPAGTIQEFENVPAGSLARLYEDARASESGSGLDLHEYVPVHETTDDALAYSSRPANPLFFSLDATRPSASVDGSKSTPLRMYMTMATWCTACKKSLPHLKRLRDTFSEDEMELWGLPIDEHDDLVALQEYAEVNDAPYQLVPTLNAQQRRRIEQTLRGNVPEGAVPVTIITDASARVLAVVPGVPTTSQLRKLLATHPPHSG
ncbi:MAG: ASPIC/UnbV domain-containing protein [Planctomycetales bacterium]|nr:ASPIC/UnbV domain-containing protein [Planctomycetales bacterium]